MAEKPEVNKSQAIRDYYKLNPKAKTQEVVDALAKQGITVTTGLVTTVKSKHNKRQAAKKAAKNEAKVTEKKPEVNKSQASATFSRPTARPRHQEVVDALAKQGITVTINLSPTSNPQSKKRRRAVKQVVAAVAPTGIGIPEIKAAFAFIKTVGSEAAAKQALAAAVEIKKVV